MENPLRRRCRGHGPICQWLTSCVQVPVPLWEVGARDVEPQTGSTVYRCSYRPQVDREFVDLAGAHQLRLADRVPVSGTQDPLLEIHTGSTRINDTEARVKSFHCRRSGVERY